MNDIPGSREIMTSWRNEITDIQQKEKKLRYTRSMEYPSYK